MRSPALSQEASFVMASTGSIAAFDAARLAAGGMPMTKTTKTA
jgi:hypothetical protein